jgi:hypothetical protein
MGVAAVALLFATVRRWAGPRTALTAAAILAFTPLTSSVVASDRDVRLLARRHDGRGYQAGRAPHTSGPWIADAVAPLVEAVPAAAAIRAER